MRYRILAINPGSTSTKISVFDDREEIFIKTLRHDPIELDKVGSIMEQDQFRKSLVLTAMKEHEIEPETLDAVVGRGGMVHPVHGGTFKINEKMLAHLKDDSFWGRVHASNLGPHIAKSIGDELGIPSFIVDPVAVDEFDDIARISGIPEITRKSLLHALNIRYTGKVVAQKINKDFSECNMIATHLGGGITVAAIKNGRLVDSNNALLGMGPFSPQRAGALPIGDLIDLAYSGQYTKKELMGYLSKKAGLLAYLGTDDGKEICDRIEKGDKEAQKYFDAMIYQIAKDMAGCSAVLSGKIDAIFITGGLAYGKYLVDELKNRIGFLAPVFVFPGEFEMEALTQGAVNVLKGIEEAFEY